jgi:hypothetical protein
MILRCTARMVDLLGIRPASLVTESHSDDDWYANLLWIDRRKCLLLMHAGTLFSVFVLDVRKADLRPIGPFLTRLLEEQLVSEGLPAESLGRLDPEDVRVGKTASRSVLGFMNDAATHLRYRIAAMGGVEWTDEVILNRYLRRVPNSRGGEYVTPLELVAQRLSERRP